MVRSASGSRGSRSSGARRLKRSAMSSRSSGVIVVSSATRAPCHRLQSCAGKHGRMMSGRYCRRFRKGRARGGKRLRQRVTGEIGMLAFTQIGQRIEPAQFVVDEAWMAHDEAAVGKAIQEGREDAGEICGWCKGIAPSESRIGPDTERRSAAGEAAAQMVNEKSLRVGET